MGWFLVFVIVAIVVGIIDDRWRKEHGINPKPVKPPRKCDYYDDNEDEEYVTRAQRRREEEKRKKEERDRREWYDDYDTFTDKDGNEHSLDYDNYCDECDEYHEE
jgi:hypothetical protein